MHTQTIQQWQHAHTYAADSKEKELKTLRVVILTAVMMAAEIAAGLIFGSMALLADGWHMGTHAAALGISYIAYRYTSRYANHPRYTFGTGKIGILASYSSAIILQIVALWMAFEAIQRLFNPRSIQFNEAILVAVIGLAVNLASMRLLAGEEVHDHHHTSAHEHEHQHSHAHEAGHVHRDTDHNLKAAYLHVLADALTSVLAIAALLAGRLWGWVWLDALMGVVGSLLITRWAIGLLRDTGAILLDSSPVEGLAEEIRSVIEGEADNRISDLHTWRIGDDASAAIISLVTHDPKPVEYYRQLLLPVQGLKHVTIEIHPCLDEICLSEQEAS